VYCSCKERNSHPLEFEPRFWFKVLGRHLHSEWGKLLSAVLLYYSYDSSRYRQNRLESNSLLSNDIGAGCTVRSIYGVFLVWVSKGHQPFSRKRLGARPL